MPHNGGRTQLNVNFATSDSSGEWWALDMFKQYGSTNYASTLTPLDFGADGYPLANPSGHSVNWSGWLLGQDRRPLGDDGNPSVIVVTWDGNGTLNLPSTGRTTVGATSLTSTTGSGRYEFTLSTTKAMGIGITSWSTRITNIKIFFKDRESLLGTTYFNPDFTEKLTEAKIAVIRFLNWQDGNNSNVVKWDHRKPLTYATWSSRQMRPELYCGVATGTNDYALNGNVGNGATVPGIIPTSGDPADGTVITLKFQNAQTTGKVLGITFDATNDYVNWTAHGLSVGDPVMFGLDSGGSALPLALNIWDMFYVKTVVDADHIEVCRIERGGAKVLFASAGTGTFFANRVATLALNGGTAIPIKTGSCQAPGGGQVFDNTTVVHALWYDHLQRSWCAAAGVGSNAEGFDGFNNGVPYEVGFQLCVEKGAHPWFSNLTPGAYMQSDFFAGLTQMAYDYRQANPWMIPRLETIPNETFNPPAKVVQIVHAQCLAIAYFQNNASWTDTTGSAGTAGNFHAWCGMINSKAAQVVYNIFYPSGGTVGGPTCPYQTVTGVWTVNFRAGVSSTNDQRFTSALYISTFGAAAGDAAHNWLTHAAGAAYFFPESYNNTEEVTWATNYVNTGVTTDLDAYVEQMLNGADADEVPDFVTGASSTFASLMDKINNYSTKDGVVLKMNMYEGGYDTRYENNFSVGYTTTQKQNIHTFRLAAKNHPKMYDVVKKLYEGFEAQGGEYPSQFLLGGTFTPYTGMTSPSFYPWAIWEDLYTTNEPPQWAAIRLHNNNKRRLRLRT